MARMIHGVMLCLVTAATVSVTVGCSRGNVSGSLYGVTIGGEAKRGADVEIVLVNRTEAIARKLRDLEAAFTRELGPAKAAHEEAERRASSAPRSDYAYGDLSIAAAAARGASSRSSSAALDAARELARIRGQYNHQARAILSEAKAASARTDVNGAFEFKDVKPGQYLIFAEWAVARMQHTQYLGSYPVTDRIEWMLPIDVVSGENKVQLSSSNSGWPFSFER